MGKSFLIFLFIAIVLGGGFAGYLFYSKLKTTPNKAINAIPSNAALIIESQDFQNAWTKLNETTLFWRNLDSVDFIKTLNNNTNFLDSLFSSESKVAMLAKKSPAYISAHPVGANDYSFLFLISLKNIRQISEFQKVVAKEIRNAYEKMENRMDVIFKGHTAPSELKLIIPSALALTYVSFFEGFGIPIVEAMRSGTPVITSKSSSMPEVAGDAALLSDPFSVNSIAQNMIVIASDIELRKNLIAKGLERAQKFTWDITAEKLWHSIEKTIAL